MTIAIQSPGPFNKAAAISTLTLAFSSDPAARWTYPDSHQYLTYFPELIRAIGGKAFENQGVQSVPAGTGAALWLPPGVEPDEEEIGDVISRSVHEEQRSDLFDLFEQMGQARPSEPHWYLPLMGVDPAQQRKGYGSMLLREVLAICDRDQVPAHLEATSVDNAPLYLRHGFNVSGIIQAGSSPKLYAMTRPPR
jgi:GNAT superfamily N-acetyltransferase